jgi:hypothetical protein
MVGEFSIIIVGYFWIIINSKRASSKRTHFLLREDLRHLEEITAQTKLLCAHQAVYPWSKTLWCSAEAVKISSVITLELLDVSTRLELPILPWQFLCKYY